MIRAAMYLLALLIGTTAPSSAAPLDTPFSQGQRTLDVEADEYPVLRDTDPTVIRVKTVFARVARVSGRRPGTPLEVFVVDTPRVRVHALPNGYIVVSRGAVALTGQDDHALAFLLAHEVAHQVRDHLSLLATQEQLAAQSPSGRLTSPRPAQQATTAQAIELEADRLGVLFAALAGYRPGAAGPILERVVARVGSGPLHPDPARRVRAIGETMRAIAAHIDVFEAGLFYLVTGQYEGAARALESFASLFPAREVYGNLGLAYHKRALLYQAEDKLVHSLALDPLTRAAATVRDARRAAGGPRGPAHPVFRESMEKAVTYYRLAVDADPDYAPARVNLGAAYIDLGEYDFAVGELKHALRIDPALTAAHLNRGVAYLKNGSQDLAEKDFLRAAALDPADPDPHQNLSVLYAQNGRAAADKASETAARLRSARRDGGGSAEPETSLGPATIGMRAERLRDALRGGTVRTLKIPLRPRREHVVLSDARHGTTFVVEDGVVSAAMAREDFRGRTKRGIGIGSLAADVRAAYGAPIGVAGASGRRLWTYPAHGLVVVLHDDRVAGWWVHEARR